LDWTYYEERLGSVIQKLITIPAALQRVPNPVPRVRHPDWLHKRVMAKADKFQQHKLTDMFKKVPTRETKETANDMEDFGAPKDSFSLYGRRRTAVTRKKRSALEDDEVSEIPPDPMEDYSGWLRVTRRSWRQKRQQRKGNGTLPMKPSAPKGNGSIAAMLQNQSFGMSGSQWDVVQIAPTNRPGEFKLWLAINSTFQSLRLRVPREFYLNLKKAPVKGTFDAQYQAVPIVRTLPRGHSCRHLYKITVAEQIFVDGEAHFSSLINNPNVDGAYELQVPLAVRALLQFGSSCRLTSEAGGGLSLGLDKGFDIGDLESAGVSITRHHYLNDGKGMRYIYLHHSSSGPRQMFTICITGQEAKFYIVDAARNRPQLPNPKNLYADEISKMSEAEIASSLIDYPDNFVHSVAYFGNESAAVKAISKELANHRRGPNMIVLRSPLEKDHFLVKAPIFADFPIITAGQPSENDASPLMWLVTATKAVVRDYLGIGLWLASQIELASHYDVPLGVSQVAYTNEIQAALAYLTS
jgi:DNA polymerase epsilon subunit 1